MVFFQVPIHTYGGECREYLVPYFQRCSLSYRTAFRNRHNVLSTVQPDLDRLHVVPPIP